MESGQKNPRKLGGSNINLPVISLGCMAQLVEQCKMRQLSGRVDASDSRIKR
jgi:hypothetical protein